MEWKVTKPVRSKELFIDWLSLGMTWFWRTSFYFKRWTWWKITKTITANICLDFKGLTIQHNVLGSSRSIGVEIRNGHWKYLAFYIGHYKSSMRDTGGRIGTQQLKIAEFLSVHLPENWKFTRFRLFNCGFIKLNFSPRFCKRERGASNT